MPSPGQTTGCGFAALKVQSDTVTWANGFDLAPEYLHARLHARQS
jgi:hypothetical protein